MFSAQNDACRLKYTKNGYPQSTGKQGFMYSGGIVFRRNFMERKSKYFLQALRIALGCCLSIWIAELLHLEYAISAGSITIAVAPDEVARLLAASDEGSLRLALPGEQALELVEEGQAAPTSVPAEQEQDGGEGEGATPSEEGGDAE